MSTPHHSLLHELESHHSQLTSNDVSWAFSNPKTLPAVSDWVEQHLTPSTLLTLEEGEILKQLNKTGTLKKLSASHNALLPPDSAAALTAEAEALEASTQRLLSDAAQLREQKTLLANIHARQKAENARRKKLSQARQKKWEDQRAELQAGVDDMMVELQEEIVDVRATLKDSARDKEEVQTMLDSDDRVLTRLERMAKEIVVPAQTDNDDNDMTPELKVELDRIGNLVDKLAQYRTAGIKSQLDRVFRESYDSENAMVTNGDATKDPELLELQTEIDSFYAEIPTVAAAAARAEYLFPAMRAAKRTSATQGENWVIGGEYLATVLHHLEKKTSHARDSLQKHLSRDRVVQLLIATIEAESKAPIDTPVEEDAEDTRAPLETPRSMRRNCSPEKSLRGSQFMTPSRRRGVRGSIDFSHEPELAMLAHLGLTLPASDTRTPAPPASINAPPTATSSGITITDQFLTSQISQLQQKTRAQASAVEGAQEEVVGEAVREAWAVSTILEMAVRAENEFPGSSREAKEGAGAGQAMGGAQMRVGREVREGLVGVDVGVKECARKLQGCAKIVEGLDRAGGDMGGFGRKGGFVERWSR